MSPEQHEQYRSALAAAALDGLTDRENEALFAHVAGCPECARELAEYYDTTVVLGLLAPPRPLAPERVQGIRSRLLARAAADGVADSPAAAPHPLRGASPEPVPDIRPAAANGVVPRWTGWLVAAGLAALLVTHHAFHQTLGFGWLAAGVLMFFSVGLGAYAVWERDRVLVLRAAIGGALPARSAAPQSFRVPWLAAATLAAISVGAGLYAQTIHAESELLRDSLAAATRERDHARAVAAEMVAALTGPQVRVIQLASGEPPAPSAKMFWNPATDRWTFFAYNLPQVAQGRAYQLWLVTPGQPVSAGIFRPGEDGRAVVEAKYPLASDSLRAVAVTEEPAGGVPAPTGPMVLTGPAES